MAFDGSCHIDGAHAARPAHIHSQRARLGWLAWLRGMIAVREERRRLRDLDPRTLQDLGISREQALLEADRPFWDLPQDRRY